MISRSSLKTVGDVLAFLVVIISLILAVVGGLHLVAKWLTSRPLRIEEFVTLDTGQTCYRARTWTPRLSYHTTDCYLTIEEARSVGGRYQRWPRVVE